MIFDQRGLAVTTDCGAAVALFDQAVAGFVSHRGAAPGLLAAALEADTGLAAGHCLAGFFQLLLARAELYEPAGRSLALTRESLAERGGTPREHGLAAALACWCGDDMTGAAERLDRVLDEHPLDLMTGKLVHALRLMLGDFSGMRRSVERMLPRWPAECRDRGFLHGWHAFALGETGEIDAAERTGQRALDLAPDDVWGCHAVAHVYETRGQGTIGLVWLASHAGRWAEVNNFVRHLSWHQALYHLRLGEADAVLALYDHRIRDKATDDYRDIANAVSLLYRLEAAGIAVGERWEELATLAEARCDDHALVFAELHRLLALAGAGRLQAAARQIAAMDDAARRSSGTQARVAATVGTALARCILAERSDGAAVEDDLRDAIVRLGGSRVQRQIFERALDRASTRRAEI